MTAPQRILVVDDELHLRRALKVILRNAGYEPVLAADAEEALALAGARVPDAGLVDLRLPGVDGVQLCRRLREFTEMPLILLSVVGDEADKVRALNAGADDYVTKPFGAEELLARLRANLRRSTAAQGDSVVTAGELEIDLANRLVTLAGRPVALTPTEWDVLALLVRNRPKLLTHGAILREVWGPGYSEGDSQVLRQQVANLRAKIEPGPGPTRAVVTVPRVGYRFVGS